MRNMKKQASSRTCFVCGRQNDISLKMSQQTLDLCQKIGYRYREAWSYICIGSTLLKLDLYRQAIENFEKGMKIAELLDDQDAQTRITWRQGIAFDILGMYEQLRLNLGYRYESGIAGSTNNPQASEGISGSCSTSKMPARNDNALGNKVSLLADASTEMI